jgi:hypothetical protein
VGEKLHEINPMWNSGSLAHAAVAALARAGWLCPPGALARLAALEKAAETLGRALEAVDFGHPVTPDSRLYRELRAVFDAVPPITPRHRGIVVARRG